MLHRLLSQSYIIDTSSYVVKLQMSPTWIVAFTAVSIASSTASSHDLRRVVTRNGTVVGTATRVAQHLVLQLLGVPFAEPPVGNLRFARP